MLPQDRLGIESRTFKSEKFCTRSSILIADVGDTRQDDGRLCHCGGSIRHPLGNGSRVETEEYGEGKACAGGVTLSSTFQLSETVLSLDCERLVSFNDVG